jgi:hypothetical protein
VILEGDSLSIVKAIHASREPTRHSYGQVIEDNKVVLRSHRTWRICHTKRGAIGVAHRLAKEATRCYDKIWLEETPSCISHIVSLKLSTLLL